MMNSGAQHVTVSVVTPSYNQGQYLAATIASVLAQEGDFYLDYQVIDGGSADDSVEIIRRYERLLNDGEWPVKCRGIRYRWLSEKDEGQTDAIVKGFRMAEGELLAWLNSDDTYLPDALHRAVDVFVREPEVCVLYGRTWFTDAAGEIIGTYPTAPFDYDRLAMFNFVCQPAAFFRKTALAEAGGLDLTLQYVMDYDLWIRLARKFAFRYLPEFLATYRLHEESKTISPADALANHKEALDTVRTYYGWAPLNRVYVYSRQLVRAKMPPFIGKSTALTMLCTLPLATVRYLSLNRGVRLADLKMITPANLRKLFLEWIDIYKEYRT